MRLAGGYVVAQVEIVDGDRTYAKGDHIPLPVAARLGLLVMEDATNPQGPDRTTHVEPEHYR